jgi:hypothetical protein
MEVEAIQQHHRNWFPKTSYTQSLAGMFRLGFFLTEAYVPFERSLDGWPLRVAPRATLDLRQYSRTDGAL